MAQHFELDFDGLLNVNHLSPSICVIIIIRKYIIQIVYILDVFSAWLKIDLYQSCGNKANCKTIKLIN